ncbi:MAG: hypothetical protein HY898_03070 [Deltaproteobacteria bacterium]|nr:hypothetical protein [Deltaproteobacteria bacterium]
MAETTVSTTEPKVGANNPVKLDPPKEVTPAPNLQPASLPTGENKTGVSSQAISVPKGPGTIQGMGESFSAQPSTGIATFSVPFALPKARGAAQPSLSLGYSSSSGSGVAGIGWDVSVPFISRQTDRGLPGYLDQDAWHPAQDRFIYNGGQELIPVCDSLTTCPNKLEGELLPDWAGSWQYFRPRVEGSFLRFFWNRAEQLWRVQDKSGVVLELGGDPNALEVDPGNSSRVFRWNLRRQIDANNNQVLYYYTHDGGTAYISDLYDTSPAQAGAAGLTLWAHHTRLTYVPRPDPSVSFNRGWKITRALRLSGVDVTAFTHEADASRKLVRRYHLSYDPTSHHTLLASLQVEGRCGEVEEHADGSLPATSCARLPAMTFNYSHVSSQMVDGFEDIDTTVHHLAGSPNHSVDEDYTDLYDVNSDGLPDVVTMMPANYNGKHGLWFNGGGGNPDKFGPQTTIGVKGGVSGANETVITKHNPNLVALDLDGDATINLLHMPKVKTYGIYAPELVGSQWWWSGRAVSTADQLDARIDLTADALDIRVFDVNADGLVDVVKSGGTSFEVWFALGRYPGGDGLFGSATWTGAEAATLSMAPVLRCVPWASTPVRFSDPDIKLGDMNGDGLTDIVRVRQGDMKYWPGRGDGTFGTGPLGCAGSTFSQNSFVQMSASPQYSDPNGSQLHLDDVNGDGTADLVQIRFDAVDVWLNIDGEGWTDRRTLDHTPPSPSYQNRVRIVDMNGSGTRDILWGDGYDYKYIDLSGGKRPWLLTEIANGLGKTTQVDYTTSTAQMLAAEKSGSTWTRKAPMPLQVVSRVTVRDNLGTVKRPDGVYVTEYTYRDPVYDGLQREFRGFSKTEVKSLGDLNSPTSATSTEFELGERPTSSCLDSPTVDYTDPANRWRDNPREALKGLSLVSETYAVGGNGAPSTYASTTMQSYALRRLYRGLDGRYVYSAHERGSATFAYDTASFQPASQSTPYGAVMVQDKDATQCSLTRTAFKRASAGTATMRKGVEVDLFGNRTVATDSGADGDEELTAHTSAALVPTPSQPLGEGNWSWRTVESWITGSVHTEARKRTLTSYDLHGNPKETKAWLQDVGSLDRTGPDGTSAGTAPLPAGTHAQGFADWITTGNTWYDSFGNAVIETGPNGRCREVDYDGMHAQLPMQEIIHAGAAVGQHLVHGDVEVDADCGTTQLATSASYDRALQSVTSVTGPDSATTRIEYDGFGRLVNLYRPMESTGAPSSVPSIMVEYRLPDVTQRPVSLLITQTQDGATDDAPEYHLTYAFVDGLGRSIVTLSEADHALDGFDWIVEGLTDYDLKGAARRKYLAWGYDGAPDKYDLSAASPAKYGQQRYDAFGRAVETIGLDGTVTLQTRYHALSADAWDAEDIGPGPHQGTFASELKDGHGRVVKTTERVRVGGAIEQRHVATEYLPSGEVIAITRLRGTDQVRRTIGYDSLGRMVDNLEPSTSAGPRHWRYAYDDAGDLVGTSDARGCGVNYGYDAAGRLLTEDYSPCQANHPPYDDRPEVAYQYDAEDTDAACMDAQSFTLGRLVSVTDRASKSISRYDGRGRVVQVAKRVNGPDGSTATEWFCKESQYDGADRPTRETTGARLNVNGDSSVTTGYSARGAVRDVTSTYGDLVRSVKRDADGLVTEIAYGDGAQTTTAFDYDDLRRLRNLTTYRGSLPPGTPQGTAQMLLQDEQYAYDRVGNPVEIRDWRTASEWETGFQPVSRKMAYDDLYRLSRIDYQYPQGTDVWRDPYAAEVSDNQDGTPKPAPRVKAVKGLRPQKQTWTYDWLGNTSSSDDDEHAFYERSLGNVHNQGYRLTGAGKDADNKLEATYDAAGNLTSLTVQRTGECIPAKSDCHLQTYGYEWDEVGRLVVATRADGDVKAARLEFAYDASDARVRKTSGERHDVYIFGSLELRQAEYSGGQYQVTEESEVPYLFAHGVRLARVVHTAPDAGSPSARVFLELGDHLGSTAVVLDRETGELVERSTAYAYGAPESSYRPSRWQSFREDYRFTGKEDDIEVGLVYFGARYLNPQLGRWISADPLAVHAPGKADLNLYAYVHGMVLIAVDPVGLDNAPLNPLSNAPEARAALSAYRNEKFLSRMPDNPFKSSLVARTQVSYHELSSSNTTAVGQFFNGQLSMHGTSWFALSRGDYTPAGAYFHELGHAYIAQARAVVTSRPSEWAGSRMDRQTAGAAVRLFIQMQESVKARLSPSAITKSEYFQGRQKGVQLSSNAAYADLSGSLQSHAERIAGEAIAGQVGYWAGEYFRILGEVAQGKDRRAAAAEWTAALSHTVGGYTEYGNVRVYTNIGLPDEAKNELRRQLGITGNFNRDFPMLRQQSNSAPSSR